MKFELLHFRRQNRFFLTFKYQTGLQSWIRTQSQMSQECIKVRSHYAARQNATHCSFAARQKLLGICRQCDRVHIKKEFFADLLQVTKTVERDRQTWSDFFLKLADTILKPITHHMPCGFF